MSGYIDAPKRSDSFDFDTVLDRLSGSASKWEKYRDRDVLPLWIADLDFKVAPPLGAALFAWAARGDFGYHSAPRNLPAILADYCARHYHWTIHPESVVWLPALVPAINLAVRSCCSTDEAALTFSPIYPPFIGAPALQGRPGVVLPLIASKTGTLLLDYSIDFDRLDALLSATTPPVRLLQLCHPHNPIGRLWRLDELTQLAERVLRHKLYVLSDEVHADLILDGTTRHLPFAALSPEIASRTITINGPGKTFNTAGLGIAWAVISDPKLRNAFRKAMARLVPEPTAPAWSVLSAALTEGEPWRQALLAYLSINRDRVSAALDHAGLPHTQPEVTYLSWFDARSLDIAPERLAEHFEHHGLGLSDGADFGLPGHLRLNFGLPRSQLDQALVRLQNAVAGAIS